MQESSEKIDAESQKFLQDVKKGKPRKWVMIKEGVQIDKMYVFKRGPFERYVRLARQGAVRGEAFWGVVRGDGLDIHFELSREDGFNQPPGKAIRLKEFLKEETKFKFEPDYVIVDSLTPVDESDDEQPVEAQAEAQGEVKAEAAVVVPDEEDKGEKFITLLKKILPHVKRALAVPTSVSEELKAKVAEAQSLGRQRDFEQGLATLRFVGQLTKTALAEMGAAPAANDANGDIDKRLRELRSLAQQSEAAGTSLAKDIERRFQQAEALVQKKQLDRAGKSLDQLERLVKRAQAETNRRREWLDRIAELEPRLSEQLHNGSAEVGQMRAIMDYARRQAEKRQYVKALVGLQRLEPMLASSA
jgi:hypothetical protein